MSTYSTFAATGGADGPAGGGGGLVCGTTSYTVCADSNRSLAICLTCECPSGNITLPNATGLSPGSPTFVIKNENTNTTYLLRDNTSCVLTAILPGQAVDASLYDNSAQQGEWVIGKFSKPTPFNPVSTIDIWTGGRLENSQTNYHDCCEGFSSVTYDFPTCCYKAVTFKSVNGEYTKVGEVAGKLCKCNFDVIPAHNGFVIFSCLFCSCGSSLVDYAKFITAINCDSTCAVTFVNCCDVGCCHNAACGSTLGKWICYLTEGTSMLTSYGILNCDSRCLSVAVAKLNTTTTGAPTCCTCAQCIINTTGCSNYHCSRHNDFCYLNTLCYDRPKCCAEFLQHLLMGHPTCMSGDGVYIYHVKGDVQVLYAGFRCGSMNCSSANNVAGILNVVCDQPFVQACLTSPNCNTKWIKLNHCGNSCCSCEFYSWHASQCGPIPVGCFYYLQTGCCRCVMDAYIIKCMCQNCFCQCSLSAGSERVDCLNYCNMSGSTLCNDALCLYIGKGIAHREYNHWFTVNRNDLTVRRRNSNQINYSKHSDGTATFTKVCDSQQSQMYAPNNFDNTFLLVCDCATCLAGFILNHTQTSCCLRFKKFHFSATHYCQICCFHICLPTAFAQSEYQDHCVCTECIGFKYWDSTNCRMCSYNITRGLATLWCITGACNTATVCCIGTTAGNSFAGAISDNVCRCHRHFNHSNTRFITTTHSQCGAADMRIYNFNLDTFPGAVFCCEASNSGRKWGGGYSGAKCRLLFGGEQWICNNNIYTNTGIVHGVYNPSNNCYTSFDSGTADAIQGTIQGSIPGLDVITLCNFTDNKMLSFIRGKD